MRQTAEQIRLTPQRRAVLEAVREGGHLTAAEIWEKARTFHPTISFATVYNAVHFLCRSGLLLEIPFGNGATLYDARTDRHDHALCTVCGEIADFESAVALEIARQAAEETGYAKAEAQVTISGVCPHCQRTPRA